MNKNNGFCYYSCWRLQGLSAMVAVNLETMAKILRISPPTMRKLLGRYDGFPVLADGSKGVAWQFDPAAVVAFVRAKRTEEAAAKQRSDELLAQISLPLEEVVPLEERGVTASDRLKVAQAILRENEVSRQRAFLVLASDMRSELARVWPVLADFLEELPHSIGRRHNLPAEVASDVRRLVGQQSDELRRRLGDLLPPDEADIAVERENAIPA